MIRPLIRAVLLLGALALPAVAHEQPGPAADAAAVLRQAESAYDRGLGALAAEPGGAKAAFTESAAAYRELAEGRGIRNARLLANLGNACLLSGDAGRAVLNFRRAERIEPNNPTVRAGLALARSRVGTIVELGTGVRAAAWLSAWRGIVPQRSLLVVSVFAWGAGWLALAMSSVSRVRRGAGAAVAAIVLGGLGIGALIADDAVRQRSPDAVLVADGVIGRKGPGGAAYEASFDKPLGAGVEFTIVEERGDWLRVRLVDGRQTWVPRSAAERV